MWATCRKARDKEKCGEDFLLAVTSAVFRAPNFREYPLYPGQERDHCSSFLSYTKTTFKPSVSNYAVC